MQRTIYQLILYTMQVTEHLGKAKDTLVSFEVMPPLKGRIISYINEQLDPIMEF